MGGGGRAKRKPGKALSMRHEHFRNKCFRLLAHEGRWMTPAQIWDCFMDGHPMTRTRTGEKSSMRHVPNLNNGAMHTILKRDGRFKYRYLHADNYRRHRKQMEFKVDEDEIENRN